MLILRDSLKKFQKLSLFVSVNASVLFPESLETFTSFAFKRESKLCFSPKFVFRKVDRNY